MFERLAKILQHPENRGASVAHVCGISTLHDATRIERADKRDKHTLL